MSLLFLETRFFLFFAALYCVNLGGPMVHVLYVYGTLYFAIYTSYVKLSYTACRNSFQGGYRNNWAPGNFITRQNVVEPQLDGRAFWKAAKLRWIELKKLTSCHCNFYIVPVMKGSPMTLLRQFPFPTFYF